MIVGHESKRKLEETRNHTPEGRHLPHLKTADLNPHATASTEGKGRVLSRRTAAVPPMAMDAQADGQLLRHATSQTLTEQQDSGTKKTNRYSTAKGVEGEEQEEKPKYLKNQG